MTRHTLKALWQAFDERVLYFRMPARHREEMRIAFYSGAKALFSIATAIDENTTEVEGAAIFASLDRELQEFVAGRPGEHS